MVKIRIVTETTAVPQLQTPAQCPFQPFWSSFFSLHCKSLSIFLHPESAFIKFHSESSAANTALYRFSFFNRHMYEKLTCQCKGDRVELQHHHLTMAWTQLHLTIAQWNRRHQYSNIQESNYLSCRMFSLSKIRRCKLFFQMCQCKSTAEQFAQIYFGVTENSFWHIWQNQVEQYFANTTEVSNARITTWTSQ